MSSGGRVSIPNSVRKTIQNIKEITGNHSEDEIYAMLKECSMDPNETAQKLLFQDPFHEVKRKRDRKKESLNKEPAESKWKPGVQGRGNRGGRGNYQSRHIYHDAGGGRNTVLAKENGVNQVSEEDIGLSTLLPTPHDTKNKETTVVASSSTVAADDPVEVVSETPSVIPAAQLFTGGGSNQSETTPGAVSSKLDSPSAPAFLTEGKKIPTIVRGTGDMHGHLMSNSSNISASRSAAPSPGVYLSSSDPVLMPSQDLRVPSSVGTIRREVGSQRTSLDQYPETSVESKSIASSSEGGSSFMQGKPSQKLQGVGKNQLSESSQPVLSTHGSSSVGRPSSNYSSRSQQVIGPQKVGPSKEWKPKMTNPVLSQGSGTVDSSDSPATPLESISQSQPASSVLDLKEASSELERKLEESHISDSQHVIIPNHLHVPEAEKLGFCFGSFDASFGFNTSGMNGPVSDKSPSLSETSEGTEEGAEEQPSSNQIELVGAEEGDYPDLPPSSSSNIPENLSSEGDLQSSVAPDYSESKQETALPAASHQYPVVQTSPNFSFGFVPPMIGSQLAPFESIESQARDGSRVPSFVVPQPFDPASYYAQFYRSGADSDGRISPFHTPGVATKYNGNVAVLSQQASQSSQEVGNNLILSTAGPTPLVTQAAGVMQSSIAVTQQPLPVFRQPAGVHLPHYPNLIPYGPYFSPFYVQPPAIHQFLSNGTFPQQPQAGNVYPPPPVATTKYPLSQYKTGNNTGNSAHIGMPGSYGPYGSSLAGYNPSSAASAGNSTSNEDLAGSQFKENNVYITGQQSEGSGVWIAGPGREISGLQASSFYNLPQGQVAFTPTQAGHGTFAGMYHPAQPVTTGAVHPLLQQSQTMAGGVDMVGPTGSVYQQPQPTQINWPNNY